MKLLKNKLFLIGLAIVLLVFVFIGKDLGYNLTVTEKRGYLEAEVVFKPKNDTFYSATNFCYAVYEIIEEYNDIDSLHITLIHQTNSGGRNRLTGISFPGFVSIKELENSKFPDRIYYKLLMHSFSEILKSDHSNEMQKGFDEQALYDKLIGVWVGIDPLIIYDIEYSFGIDGTLKTVDLSNGATTSNYWYLLGDSKIGIGPDNEWDVNFLSDDVFTNDFWAYGEKLSWKFKKIRSFHY